MAIQYLVPIRTQPISGVGTFVQMSCKQDFTTALHIIPTIS